MRQQRQPRAACATRLRAGSERVEPAELEVRRERARECLGDPRCGDVSGGDASGEVRSKLAPEGEVRACTQALLVTQQRARKAGAEWRTHPR